jgi:hypothetical protein
MYFLLMTTGVSNIASPSFGPESITGRLLQIVQNTCGTCFQFELEAHSAGHCRLKICEVKSVLAGVLVTWWFIVNTNACHKRKFMVQISLSYLQLLIMNISFVPMTCFSQCQICFSNGFCDSCWWKLFSHGHTHLVCIKMCLSINDMSLVMNTVYHEGLT